MKKIIFALLGLIMLVGCKTTQKVAEVKQTEPLEQPQKLEAEKPMVWKQEIYPKLVVGDPILFFNSSEIILSGDIPNKTFVLQDGVINYLDSTLVIEKTVPVLTPGKLVDINQQMTDGKILRMDISFSQNDATYQFNFRLRTDGAFTLNSNAKVFYLEKEYKVKADVKNAECLLLVKFVPIDKKQRLDGSAEGQSVSGTKVIK